MTKALGMQDINVGHSEFDQIFVVKGDDQNFIRRFLTEDIIQLFAELKDLNLTLTVKNNSFQFSELRL